MEYDFSEKPSRKIFTLDRGSLHRVLGIRDLFAIGYSDVGSSIYYALGITTLYALGATPLALALAGIAFFCTVLTYSEMASALPEAGGSCSFARHAFNDLVSFIAGWALLLDYIVTIAISAYTVGPYLSHFFPVLKTQIGNIPFTLLILGILLSLNIFGIKQSSRVSLLLCIFSVVTQLAIISIGALLLLNLPSVFHHLRIGILDVDWSPTWPQFWKGVSMAMVAYIGIESIAQLGGETREPGKKLPAASIAVMLTLFLMYFGIALVALSAIHPKELSTRYLEDPMAGIVASLPVGSTFLLPWIGILGATILFVAANAGLIGASRLTFAMGDYFELPRFFYRLHPRFKTPYISLIVFACLAGLVVFVARRLTFIAELYNFGAMLSFTLAHLALIGLRIRKPTLNRPFKIPWNLKIKQYQIPLTAIIGFLATFAVWIDVIITKPAGRNLGFLWMAIGIASYLWYRRRQRLPPTAHLEIEKVTIPGYIESPVKKILVATHAQTLTRTVPYATRIAKAYSSSITALYVIEIPEALPLDIFFPEQLAMADKTMENAQAISRDYEVPIETQILQSRSAGETIVDVAIKGQYDLIVLGSPLKKTSVPGSSLLGSTVDYVLKNAHCRVWICSER